jgi:hypothetical protein
VGHEGLVLCLVVLIDHRRSVATTNAQRVSQVFSQREENCRRGRWGGEGTMWLV